MLKTPSADALSSFYSISRGVTFSLSPSLFFLGDQVSAKWAYALIGSNPTRGLNPLPLYHRLPFSKRLRDNTGEAAMQVLLEIPEDLALQLADDPSGVTHAALEAVALEGVRSGRFTVSQARRLLRIESRYEMDGFLKAHGVFLDLTLDDVRKDSETALAFSR
jgi:hypothetical protein